MPPERLAHLKFWFSDYIQPFIHAADAEGQYALRQKQAHTARVGQNIVSIGTSLGLSTSDLRLAEAVALFHDIGRFKQYERFHTFSDRHSINHAALGLRELNRSRAMAGVDRQQQRIIRCAIAHHNAFQVPALLHAPALFFARLIRDADKLDIWHIFADYFQQRQIHQNNTMELNLSEDPSCSKPILKALFHGTMAKLADLKTLNDFKLLQISWVYDLNFKPTFEAVCQRALIEQIAKSFPRDTEIRAAVRIAREFVSKQLE
ncbi:MAG: HD domain-containing protein [Desulfobacterales bacterium]|nr:HD domain-containing protein [Desulfobacterales bacterium]